MTIGEITVDRPAEGTRSLEWVRPLAIFAVAVACLLPVAYISMFTGFHGYDDEGYFLITLKHYLSGRPLFTEALPIYGPVYYEIVGGAFRLLGLAPTHDAGRWLTVAVWTASTWLGGVAAYRLTRSVVLGLAAVFVTFKALEALVNEPVQPAGLTSSLLLSLVLVATFRQAKPRLTAVAIGAIVAALFLVKVNVGVFAAMAVAFAWAGTLPPRRRLPAWALIAALVVAAPFVLAARFLDQAWALEFAAVVSLAAAAVAVTSLAAPVRQTPAPLTVWTGAGGAAVAVAGIGVALAGGTKAEDMWNGLVVLAFRFPGVLAFPITMSLVAVLFALGCLVAAIAAATRPARMSPGGAGLLRTAVGAGTWFAILLLPTATYLFAVPLAWVAARAPATAEDDPVGAYPRLLVPMLAVTAALQGYPVNGTQVSLGALPLMAAAAITFADGLRQCRRHPISRIAPLAALAVNAAAVALVGLVVLGEFDAATPLGLPGAESVRVQADQASQLRQLVSAIKANCSSFITMPGMDSLYLWSGQDEPAELSSEVWWLVLDDGQQQAIVDKLRDTQGLCVVKNQRFVDFWAQGRSVPQRPLVRLIDQDFTVTATFGDYQLLVRSAAPS